MTMPAASRRDRDAPHITAEGRNPFPDRRFIDMAFALGRRGMGRTWPNPAVGALVVRDDGGGPVIVGRGWTQAGGRPHAEVEALRRAGAAARGATLYATLEPCSHHGKSPPCADAIIAAGIRRVVCSLDDPNPLIAGRGHQRLRDAGIVVEVGIGELEARAVHAGHILRMREGRPFVTLKMALSADGKVGLAGRKPAAISCEAMRARVHLSRAESDAILVGIGTALADDPQLTCRLPGMADRSPVRVVLDPRLDLPLSSQLAQTASQVPVWLMASTDANSRKADALRSAGVEISPAAEQDGRVHLGSMLKLLAERGITRLMVEGGPKTAAAFLKAGLVDQVVLLRSPMTIGPEGIDAFDGLALEAVTRSPDFTLSDAEAFAGEVIETYDRNR
jgi:diaminohydroxyphosphoribosylaminopyrimidine deaminase / 5-amino-6-(5-phosphoribosylamino)uracil reductase